jgi:hypothetical protein
MPQESNSDDLRSIKKPKVLQKKAASPDRCVQPSTISEADLNNLNIDISCLKLSKSAESLLRNNGLVSLNRVIYFENDLLTFKRMGVVSEQEIKAQLGNFLNNDLSYGNEDVKQTAVNKIRNYRELADKEQFQFAGLLAKEKGMTTKEKFLTADDKDYTFCLKIRATTYGKTPRWIASSLKEIQDFKDKLAKVST